MRNAALGQLFAILLKGFANQEMIQLEGGSNVDFILGKVYARRSIP